jgi:hypothetical protein
MLFCGIDLHSNNCLVVVSDDADKVVYCCKNAGIIRNRPVCVRLYFVSGGMKNS